jgi:hypothetical protein
MFLEVVAALAHLLPYPAREAGFAYSRAPFEPMKKNWIA